MVDGRPLDGAETDPYTLALDHSPMPTAPAARQPIWLGMLVLYVVWGSTYLGISVAVDSIPPFLMASARFLAAGLALLVWSIAREGRAFRWPTAREGRDSTIVGALLLGGGMGMVAVGEQTVPSGITALFIALMPSGSRSSVGSSSASACRGSPWRALSSASAVWRS